MALNKRLFSILCVAGFMLVALGACSDKTPESATGSAPVTDPEALGPIESLETEIVESDNIMEGRTSGPMLPVYFDYDSSRIKDDQVERIMNNAEFIQSDSALKIRIEGNCDPRGTREYNLALGERRALSAKKYLIRLGVAPERLYTISWGEEKLLLFGHDELSWAQNRRDDFVIIK